ncbi:MAG: PDDEXK nuclease domain-containing protein [Prevotellaceae bacterium]|nr:PDDEXK nuclease domain-containing protein [Prevotellaceae bacterium]
MIPIPMEKNEGLTPKGKGEEQLFAQIKQMLDKARRQISRAVNSTTVNAYWQVGKYIVEYEQRGKARAEYGKGVISSLSKRLMAEYGGGFTVTNLKIMRQFYLSYPKGHALRDQLSWTHWRALLTVQNDEARNYYINECVAENWSTRQLERQINTLYYERMLASRDKETVRAEIQTNEPKPLSPREIIHDPFVLEFLGIKQGEHFLEGDLEQMLISKLQHFLLELGRGYCFVARQKRITLDNQHFYIDLVFYNIPARCYVLIDLKIDELTHQDLGQMQMYVNYYTRELMNQGDNPPVGIVLCAEKNDAVVEYTLPQDEKQIFAAKYMTYLPTKEELKQLLYGDNEDLSSSEFPNY